MRFINYIDKTVKESGLSGKIRKEGLNLDIYSALMIWSFLEVRGVACRSHLINLMTIGRDRIKKSKGKTLSMLAIAKSVALFFKFVNDCRCGLEIRHRLKVDGRFPSSDRKGKGSCFGAGFGQGPGHHPRGSQAHHNVFSQVIRLKV